MPDLRQTDLRQSDLRQTDLHQTARTLFDVAVAEADPAAALTRALDHAPLPEPSGRTLLIAIGKAAPAMIGAALAAVKGPHEALCVTHHENTAGFETAGFETAGLNTAGLNTAGIGGARLMRAGHPVPDAAGLAAGQSVIDLLEEARAEDHVVALISGGGSALVPAPAEGLTLDDKIALNRALLASGLDIVKMNTVRQQVSRLKGGGMLRLARPAPVTGYLLSDVIGDDLRAIASGPTVSPIGTRADAMALLREAGVWDALSDAVRRHLSSDTPDPGTPPAADNVLIGSNGQSLAAVARAAERAFATRIVTDRLIGDVAAAARRVHAAAREIPDDAPPTALLFGGETTVRLTGTGKGGRNQKLALRLAALDHEDPFPRRWVFLSGGTDGRDGPVEAAGGIVDARTWGRIAASADPTALLADNNSNAALALADALLVTGATGTNVADIQILLSVPA